MPSTSPNDLVLENMRLVGFVIKRMSGYPLMRRISNDDAIGAGYLGLVKASISYDPERGNLFVTYAYACIYHAIISACLRGDLITLPPSYGPRFSSEDGELHHLMPFINAAWSASSMEWYDRADHRLSTDEDVEHRDEGSMLEHLLSFLQERDRSIIKCLFWQGLTLEETGKRHGITKERVRQIRNKLLRQLRQLHENLLADPANVG